MTDKWNGNSLGKSLEKIFPEDDIVDVSKGKKGGDCIQTINYKDKNISLSICTEN